MTAPLAASLGDPAGVGPELLAEAWTRRAEEGLVPFFAVGGAMVIAEAAALRGLDAPVERIADPADAPEVFARAIPVLEGADGSYRPGQPDADGARLALASLTEAARLAVEGKASAIVTGPIAKSRLAQVGFAHPGQTEFVAEAAGVAVEDAVMMLAGPSLRQSRQRLPSSRSSILPSALRPARRRCCSWIVRAPAAAGPKRTTGPCARSWRRSAPRITRP